MIRNVAPNTETAPPRQHRPPAGLPVSSPAGAAEKFAQDLKRVEANHTSFEHSLPYHRLLAVDLIADGYIKLPAPTDLAAIQDLAGRAGLPPSAVLAVIDALKPTTPTRQDQQQGHGNAG